MTKIKDIKYIAFLLLAIVFNACQEQIEEEIPHSFVVPKTTLEPEAGKQFIKVHYDGNWTIQIDGNTGDWLSVNKAEGSGNVSNIILSWTENTAAEERTAEIRVDYEGIEETENDSYTIRQLAGNGSDPDQPTDPENPDKPENPDQQNGLTSFYDDFYTITAAGQTYTENGWEFYSTDASFGWLTGYFDKVTPPETSLEVKTYKSTEYQVTAFAMMPAFNVKDAENKTLNFELAYYYKDFDNSKIEVVAARDYNGSIQEASWEVVEDCTIAEGENKNFRISYHVDLKDYADCSSVHFAFRFTGKAVTYRLYNVGFNKDNGGTDPENPEGPDQPDPDGPLWSGLKNDQVNQWMELPAVVTGGPLVYVSHHTKLHGRNARNFSMLYDAENKVARWVAYPLTDEYIGGTKRTDAWGYDPKVPEKYQANLSKGIKGYDRGHQLPSGSRTCDKATNAMTFYYTNMTPQLSGLNQKIWVNLEQQVRGWKDRYDTLYVITGVQLKKHADDNIKYAQDRNGEKIAVPTAYYKILLGRKVHSNTYKAIGFWFEHKPKSGEVSANDAVTIRTIEERTGEDFFSNLPDDIEEELETSFNPQYWLN